MKTVLIIVIAVIGLFGSVVFMFRNDGAVATSAASEWPAKMGSLDTVAERWPKRAPNDASVKLKELAAALPKNEALDSFVASEITKNELTIGEPPALPEVSAIRNMLSGEEVIWERHDEVADPQAIEVRVKQMTIARALIADALARRTQIIRPPGTTCTLCGNWLAHWMAIRRCWPKRPFCP
jgi:hypothetical protein